MVIKFRSVILSILKVLAVLLIIPLAFILLILAQGYGDVYETTEISNYGKFKGNFDNKQPEKFVKAFFPNEIDESFSQIIYHYKAKKGDTYAYECYLEFVIEDVDAYQDFIERYVDRNTSSTFAYDEDFKEFVISNIFDLQTPDPQESMYAIGNAAVGKILFSDEQQRLIFVAMGMYDGGGANTVELGHFFSRFQIDPLEYMQHAYASSYYQSLGILNKDMPQ